MKKVNLCEPIHPFIRCVGTPGCGVESLWLGDTLRIIDNPTLALNRVSKNIVYALLNPPPRDGDSTVALGSLFDAQQPFLRRMFSVYPT